MECEEGTAYCARRRKQKVTFFVPKKYTYYANKLVNRRLIIILNNDMYCIYISYMLHDKNNVCRNFRIVFQTQLFLVILYIKNSERKYGMWIWSAFAKFSLIWTTVMILQCLIIKLKKFISFYKCFEELHFLMWSIFLNLFLLSISKYCTLKVA